MFLNNFSFQHRRYTNYSIECEGFIPDEMLKNTSKSIHRRSNIVKKHLNKGTICPITCEIIIKGKRFLECSKCCKPFSEKAINEWLEHRPRCPNCWQLWFTYDLPETIFENKGQVSLKKT